MKDTTTHTPASVESDELIFDACNCFLYGPDPRDESRKKYSTQEVADWLKAKYPSKNIKRESIYSFFREAVKRNILLLQPPIEHILTERLKTQYQLTGSPDSITIVNVSSPTAAEQVASCAADIIVNLILKVAEVKRQQAIANNEDPSNVKVHLGMGAGLATMLVAKRLSTRADKGKEAPNLVLHAISTGGFFIQEPHKAPITYFSYFDELRSKVEYVALFAETVVRTENYENVKTSPALCRCFEKRDEIDIVITSLAAATHKHGLLGQYLSWMEQEKLIDQDVREKMEQAGWVGDVQFRPYSKEGRLDDSLCPVRAVALFELEDLVNMAQKDNKYVVVVGGPCGECGALKTEALRPLLQNKNLRLWTHLITDVKTANELLLDNAQNESTQSEVE